MMVARHVEDDYNTILMLGASDEGEMASNPFTVWLPCFCRPSNGFLQVWAAFLFEKFH
jgi:hypothetical protein